MIKPIALGVAVATLLLGVTAFADTEVTPANASRLVLASPQTETVTNGSTVVATSSRLILNTNGGSQTNVVTVSGSTDAQLIVVEAEGTNKASVAGTVIADGEAVLLINYGSTAAKFK